MVFWCSVFVRVRLYLAMHARYVIKVLEHSSILPFCIIFETKQEYNMLKRIEFLNLKILFGIIIITQILGMSCVNQAENDNSQPNIIFIFADDLNDAIHGLGGHPKAKTPNIDRLIDHGMKFTNAHANATLCGPSRASLLTGTHPYSNKVLRNGQKMRNSPVLSI